jgi:hypothetical protein
MGADGGIKISKVSEIKQNWKSIRENLINALERDLEYADKWELKYSEEAWEKSGNLPKNIDNFTGDDIVKMFHFLANCDCPYHYEGLIITGNGDNIGSNMNTLSNVLQGVNIETWT